MCFRSATAALRVAAVLLWGSTALAQSLAWEATYDGGQALGLAWADSAGAARFDGLGNVIVGAVGFAGDQSLFRTLKYDASGSLVWSRTAFAAKHGRPWAFATGPSGEAIEVGSQDGGFWGSFAVVKFDAAGVEAWSRSDIPPGFEWGGATAVAVDAIGSVYVAGWVANLSLTDQRFVVSKYSPAGQLLWSRVDSIQTAFLGSRVHMAATPSGGVAVAGTVWVPSIPATQPRIWVLDSAGNDTWTAQVNGVDGASPTALAVDTSGNVIIGTGSPGSLQKFSSAGALLWAQEPPLGSRADVTAVSVDPAGFVVTAYGVNYVYGGPCLIDRLTLAGERLWTRAFDGPTYCAALRLRPAGGVYVGGGFLDTSDSTGHALVAAYDVAGTSLWSRTTRASDRRPSGINDLDVDAAGRIVAAGVIYGGATDDDVLTLYIREDPLPQLSYYTVPPCRAFDTRDSALGGPNPARANTLFEVQVTGRCGVPSTARALALNLTVTSASSAGNLTVFPAGRVPPPTSVVYHTAGTTRANQAVIALGDGGLLTVRANQDQREGSAHVILDVNGYFQ